jgi:hypothetical protein
MCFLVALLAFLFVLTYDPKTRNLEKYIETPQEKLLTCDNTHYENVVFARPHMRCPRPIPQECDGAIIRN